MITCTATACSPTSLTEAARALSESPDLRVLAGGTDLMVLVGAGIETPEAVLDLWGVDELRGVSVEEEWVRIGALTTFSELMRRPEVAGNLPLLAAASSEVGGVQTQNRGTLGGNIINASPAADSLPPLAVYGAILELYSVRGRRRVPFNQFYSGYKVMDRAADELLEAIHIPIPAPGSHQWFRKVGTRRAQAISKVVGAATVKLADDGSIEDARIALGSVAPTVIRLPATEALLVGQRPSVSLAAAVRRSVMAEIRPIDDIRSSASYRRSTSGNIVARFITDLVPSGR